jgi:hypothetical protein
LTVALWGFCWTKNNSEHINEDSKREGFCGATKILKGQSTELEKQTLLLRTLQMIYNVFQSDGLSLVS